MIVVRCFDSLAQAAWLRDAVDALNLRSERPDPFSSFGFFETYARHDESCPPGRGTALWFLAAFRDDALVGVLPLRRVSRRVLGMPVATVGFLVTHDTDRPHVLACPQDLREVSEAFYAHLLARRREWSLLEFAQQDERSSLLPPPAAVERSGCLVRQWPNLENCTIPVRWASLREYVQALSKKHRSNLSRQLDALFAAGEAELLGSSDPAVTPALLELCLAIEPRSWKAQGLANIGRHPERIAYFRSLLDARQPMRLSIQVLLLDGVPVAALVCGAFGPGLYALHIVYDEQLSRLAPGSTMLLLGMRQAIASGCAFFNLMSGFGYYKSRWLAQSTALHSAQIYRAGSLPYWHRRLGDWKRRVLERVALPALPRFNLARRAVVQGRSAPVAPDPAERQRTDALIAQARSGRGEFLAAAALAAALPVRPGR